MDIWYWIVEYGKVFCGYLFLMFLWPSVVFNGHLRKKTKTYRFSFCVTVMIVFTNSVVLFPGLFHCLNQELICLLFYGIFGLSLLKNIISYLDRRYKSLMMAKFPDVRTLYGRYRALVIIILFFIVFFTYMKRAAHCLSFDYIKKMKSYNWKKVRFRIKEYIWNFGHRVNNFFWKYGILALVLFFGMCYFSYGAFQIFSYGSGDLYVHHEWIYGLIEGKIFSGGVYPEAMHCFVYCMNSLFGIRVYSILLFLQGIHVLVFLVTAYILLRRIFYWRYTPIFVLMLFLCLDLKNADLINSMYRLQITLPQEFGLHTVFLCALYLVKYLNSEHVLIRKGKSSKNYWDGNLLLFMMALSASIMTHFHVVIMAFIICGSFAVFLLKKIFDKKRLLPLIVSVFCACIIALLPMSGALAQGVPFQGSINWAINVMKGTEEINLRDEQEKTVDDKMDKEDEIKDVKHNEMSVSAYIFKSIAPIYKEGYVALYGRDRAWIILLLTAIAVLICWMARYRERFQYMHEFCSGYPPAIVASVLFVIVYAAPILGLPNIIPEGRFFAPGHMMILSVAMMTVDMIFAVLKRVWKQSVLQILSLLSIIVIYGTTIMLGSFRGYLFYQVTRYNAAAMITEDIINSFPKHSYTIVSPTDELYPIIQYGWHEELLRFVEECGKEGYSLPSEYVFIFVEKQPICYGQFYFFQGPSWFGEEKYMETFLATYHARYPDIVASQSPEIIATQVSEELGKKDLPQYYNAWSMYLQTENRTILESKAYEWCQRFAEKYPSVLNIYYEDDAFVCYYFRQNMDNLPYDLGL